ncbi:MAG: hypothetical protein MR819_01660 [Prevotella sp.]|nr:hypothetical protein [Prevotella sp.]
MILQGESYEFGTVFQTVAFFLFVIPRLRPGLLSLRSVLSSRQILLLCWMSLVGCCLLARCLLDIACWISLFGSLLFGSLLFGSLLFGSLLFGNIGNQPNNKITKQQDNKTTKKTRIATFILDGAFIAQE